MNSEWLINPSSLRFMPCVRGFCRVFRLHFCASGRNTECWFPAPPGRSPSHMSLVAGLWWSCSTVSTPLLFSSDDYHWQFDCAVGSVFWIWSFFCQSLRDLVPPSSIRPIMQAFCAFDTSTYKAHDYPRSGKTKRHGKKREETKKKKRKKAVAGMDHLRYLAYVPSCIHPHVPSFHTKRRCLSLSLSCFSAHDLFIFSIGQTRAGWVESSYAEWISALFIPSHFFMPHHLFFSLTVICLFLPIPSSFISYAQCFVHFQFHKMVPMSDWRTDTQNPLQYEGIAVRCFSRIIWNPFARLRGRNRQLYHIL